VFLFLCPRQVEIKHAPNTPILPYSLTSTHTHTIPHPFPFWLIIGIGKHTRTHAQLAVRHFDCLSDKFSFAFLFLRMCLLGGHHYIRSSFLWFSPIFVCLLYFFFILYFMPLFCPVCSLKALKVRDYTWKTGEYISSLKRNNEKHVYICKCSKIV